MMTLPTAYMLALEQAVGRVLFSSQDLRDEFLDLSKSENLLRQEQQAAEQQALNDALVLLLDVSRYEREIIPKPDSRGEADELLQNDAVAFLDTPKKAPALCFSKESLLRLTRRVGLQEHLFDRFIHSLKG